jgi:hypothetical protein
VGQLGGDAVDALDGVTIRVAGRSWVRVNDTTYRFSPSR